MTEFYKKIYLLSGKIPKRDRFGIYAKTESIALDILSLVLSAALERKTNKFILLDKARVNIEVLKRLIRMMNELRIIERKKYIFLQTDLQEISKMTNGWIKFLK